MGERPLDGRRILLIEDEFLVAETLVDALQDAGAEVVGPIGWLDQALMFVHSHGAEVDGAVLDVNLHGRLSYPVADVLMQLGVPVVFTTGYDATALAEPYRACARCEKPLRNESLIAALITMGKQ